MAGIVERILRFIVTVAVLCLWAIIGLIVWVPMLLRMVAYFCGVILISSFRRVDVQAAQKRLDFAIQFYSNGFRKIIRSYSDTALEPGESLPNNEPIDLVDSLKQAMVDLAWALLFWIVILAVIVPVTVFAFLTPIGWIIAIGLAAWIAWKVWKYKTENTSRTTRSANVGEPKR